MKMTKTESQQSNRLRLASLRTAYLGFVFVGIYGATNFIYQLWSLLTPEVLQRRWLITLLAFVVNSSLWYFSRKPRLSHVYYQGIVFLQLCMYLVIATYSIYSERGMASNAVILYVIPLIITAYSYSAKTLFATAAICSATYAASVITYFNRFPSEGYKVEMYGGIVFYSAILFLMSGLLYISVQSKSGQKKS